MSRQNRLIYLLGHLTAVNDALFPLFGLGEQLYPEMHEAFITSPDRSPVQDGFSGKDLKHKGVDVNETLSLSFDKLSPSAVDREAYRCIRRRIQTPTISQLIHGLLRRVDPISYDLGQITLAIER